VNLLVLEDVFGGQPQSRRVPPGAFSIHVGEEAEAFYLRPYQATLQVSPAGGRANRSVRVGGEEYAGGGPELPVHPGRFYRWIGSEKIIPVQVAIANQVAAAEQLRVEVARPRLGA